MSKTKELTMNDTKNILQEQRKQQVLDIVEMVIFDMNKES